MNTAVMNLPATSDPEAMGKYPDARNAERDTLVDCVHLFPGMTTLDIQSAAGYLTDEIYRRLDGDMTAICVEPSAILRQRLNPAYTAIDNPVEDFHSVNDNTVDAVLGLAGLHHSNCHTSTIRESFRVLKPGGELAICDVIEGSNIAHWLNDFVHNNNSTGHSGNFVKPTEVASTYEKAGFIDIVESEKSVPWVFNRRSDVVDFFKGLFDLQCQAEVIDAALDEYFTFREEEGKFIVNWSLLYCVGRKP